MKRRLVGALLAAGILGLAGCAQGPAGGGNSASGSLGITRDDALLYAADSDTDSVLVVDARRNVKLGAVAVGRQPEKVLVAPDDTVYVTNRLGRSVSVLRRGELAEAARIDVAVEPVGLAVSADSKTLYVVNAASRQDTEFGTLLAVDTRTLQPVWELPVGAEPRALALLPGNRAAVTLYKSGDVVLVDLSKPEVLKDSTDVFTQLNRTSLGIETTGGPQRPLPSSEPGGASTSRTHGFEAIVPSADGRLVYVASLISTDATLATDPSGVKIEGGGGGYGGGSCGSSAVASPALLTFDEQGHALVDDLGTCGGSDGDRPPTVLSTNLPGVPVQGPAALAMDPTGSFLFIANRESNNVAVVPTARRDVASNDPMGKELDAARFGFGGTVQELVKVGAGPTGIAVSNDGTRAWAYNGFDHTLTRIERVGGRAVAVATTAPLAADVLSADAVQGRKLFFSAVDPRMNNPGTGISCATCHLEGREDGHVWNFPDGPRQTPALAGRMLAQTAPFHWNGEFPDLMAFMAHTVTRRMGGTGVTPEMERQVAAFLASAPGPDNLLRETTPADVLARGRAAFEKAQCQSCHAGAALTDNEFADVGTLVRTGAVRDDVTLLPKGLNTPSLLGVGRSAPYQHDGSVKTLKARLLLGKAADRHGTTSALSDAELDDLVAYLKTL